MKKELYTKALELRKKGFSYSEILKEVPVAKSTLSLWLRSVGLTTRQRQRLTEKKLKSIRRGWKKWKSQRKEKTKIIIEKAISDIEMVTIDKEKLWLIGIALYWAEGAKEKEYKPSQGVVFSNSDPRMARIFIKWLIECLNVFEKDIMLDIYIHDTHRNRSQDVYLFWSKITGFPKHEFGKIYYKKHSLGTNRKNNNINYQGLLRIRVSKSTDLNRKIAGWIEGICIHCRVV